MHFRAEGPSYPSPWVRHGVNIQAYGFAMGYIYGTYESTVTYQYELDANNHVVKKSTVVEPDNYTIYTYY